MQAAWGIGLLEPQRSWPPRQPRPDTRWRAWRRCTALAATTAIGPAAPRSAALRAESGIDMTHKEAYLSDAEFEKVRAARPQPQSTHPTQPNLLLVLPLHLLLRMASAALAQAPRP